MIKVLKDLFMTFNQLSPNNCVFSISYGSNEVCATVMAGLFSILFGGGVEVSKSPKEDPQN